MLIFMFGFHDNGVISSSKRANMANYQDADAAVMAKYSLNLIKLGFKDYVVDDGSKKRQQYDENGCCDGYHYKSTMTAPVTGLIAQPV